MQTKNIYVMYADQESMKRMHTKNIHVTYADQEY